MMHILHYIPGFSYGGIESMFLAWNQYLDVSEVQFDLLMRTQDDNCTGIQRAKKQNVRYYRLQPMDNVFNFMKSVFSFFHEHHDYDIVHVHEADPFIMGAAKRYGIKKIIIHSHTTSYGNGLKEKLRYIDEQITMHLFADYAFACSEAAARWKFGGMAFKTKKVSIIKNAIISEKFVFDQAKRDRIRSQLGVGEAFVIGHVGRFTTPKNQFFLMDIFEEYRKLHAHTILLMVGDGPDEVDLKDYCEKLGIMDHVRFLGTRSDIPELLQGMDCFLLPSRWEGLPVTLMEAQAAGLPCVISDVITEEAEVTDNVYRYSIDIPAQEWANALETIRLTYARKNTRQQIIDRGFDVENELIELVEKYKMIIGDKL